MDAKKLIEAAEYCAIEAHETCSGCPMCEDCHADERDPVDIAMRLLAIRDHVKAEVIAQVREWASRYMGAMDDISEIWDSGASICIGKLIEKLDELAGDERHE